LTGGQGGTEGKLSFFLIFIGEGRVNSLDQGKRRRKRGNFAFFGDSGRGVFLITYNGGATAVRKKRQVYRLPTPPQGWRDSFKDGEEGKGKSIVLLPVRLRSHLSSKFVYTGGKNKGKWKQRLLGGRG